MLHQALTELHAAGGTGLHIYRAMVTTKMETRFDSSGNFGIGTSSPSLRLHSKDTGNYQLDLDSGGTRWRMGAGWSGFHQNSFLLADTANGIRMAIDTSGNVGIGTSSPTPFKSGARVLEIKDDVGSNDSAALILTNNSSMTDDEYVGSLIFKNTDSSGTPNKICWFKG